MIVGRYALKVEVTVDVRHRRATYNPPFHFTTHCPQPTRLPTFFTNLQMASSQQPPLNRTESNQTSQPPGAWGNDSTTSVNDQQQSPVAAVGNALSAAGSMAASYLPTSVVNSLAGYAREHIVAAPR